MNKIKVLILIAIIIAGLVGVAMLQYGFPLKQFTYWWILAFTIFWIWTFKLSSGFILWVAFLIFILSALSVIVGQRSIGEILMRVSFLGWIIGLIQSMVEYKRE